MSHHLFSVFLPKVGKRLGNLQLIGKLRKLRSFDYFDAPVEPISKRVLDNGGNELGRVEQSPFRQGPLVLFNLAQTVVPDGLNEHALSDISVLSIGEKSNTL